MGHGMHELAPKVDGWYVPALQLEQELADAVEYLPTAQLEQLAAIWDVTYLPASHTAQLSIDVAPVEDERVPAGHREHAVDAWALA